MKKPKLERAIFLVCLIICIAVIVYSGLQVKALEVDVAELQYQNSRQAAQLLDKDIEIKMQEINLSIQEKIINERIKEKVGLSNKTYAGEFEITYYCPCTLCCGKTDGITASGTLAIEGQTVAADWDVLPPGTKIYIDGVGFRTVEDKGGAIVGQSLDVFMDSHSAALEAGRHKADVWIVEDVDV